MRFLPQVIGLILAGLCLAAPARGAIPQSPTATTWEDFHAARRSFNHATLEEEYRRHGSRDPRWDADAEACLAAAADYWGGLRKEQTIELADRVVAHAEAAISAGCNDPLVLYVSGRIGLGSSNHEKNVHLYQQRIRDSLRPMIERGYHGYRCYAAARAADGLWPYAPGRSTFGPHPRDQAAEAETELSDIAREQMVRALTHTTDPRHQRVLLSRILEDFSFISAAENELLYAAVTSEPAADPWLRDTLAGTFQVKLAWRARGGGFANTVTDSGWIGFEGHLSKAREHFTRAWQLDPSRPEPAAAMIEVAMGISENPAVEMRQWFDRAVTAQFDYTPAYEKLKWGLMPRWHGSHAERFAFGLECARTDRFDTEVPWELINILTESRTDRHNHAGNEGFDLWLQLGAYPHAKRVLQSYRINGAAGERWRQSINLGFAWACREWDDAAELVTILGDEWDPSAERKIGVGYDRIVFDVAIHRGRHAEAIARSRNHAAAGRLAEAIAALESVPPTELESPALKRVVADRLHALRARQAFDRGEPVRLIDEGLVGWKVLGGAWEAVDGAIVGHSDSTFARIVTTARFGDAWELSGRITFDRINDERWAGPSILVSGAPSKASARGVSFFPHTGEVRMGRAENGGFDTHRSTVPDTTFTFRVQMRQGVIDVWIDDQMVVEGKELREYDPEDDDRPGIGLTYDLQGTSIRFEDLELRLLPVEPIRRGAPPAPR